MNDKKELQRGTEAAIQKIQQKVDDDVVAVFDPRVKFASKKEEQEAAIVWSTKSIDLALDAINEGQGLRVSPFLKSDPNLRKPNLTYQYTEEEILEILRCKNDIIYFAEKYVFLKTDDGLKHIKLRPYQKDVLKMYFENRWNILLFPRQSGKCVTGSTKVDVCINGEYKTMTMAELEYHINKQHTIKNWIIYQLWKLYAWLK